MSFKRLLALCLFAAALVLPGLILAQGVRPYAVLPFKVNSDKFRHLGPGAQAMLSSRLAWIGYFEPVPQASLERAGGRLPANAAEAQTVMSQVGAEYLVVGSIDFQDKQANVDLKVYDRKGATWNKTAQVPLEGISPALERLSAEVRTEVFRRPGDDAKTVERKDQRQAQASRAPVPRNAEFVAGDTGEAPVGPSGGPVMNPQFRYEGGAETPGRWQSQSLRYASVSMATGDFVGDKKNRIITASANTIYAYEFMQVPGERGVLKPLGELKLSMRLKILRVSLLDLDRDGRAEIIISAVDDPEGNAEPKAFIYNFAGGKFEQFLAPQKLYLAVVRTPPTYQPVLVGQAKGFHGPFDEAGVSEMNYADGSLQPVRKLRLPSIANAFNFTYLPEGNSHKIVVLNEYSHMKVYTPDLDVQFSQNEGYNSSAVYIIVDERLPGMDMGRRDSGVEEFYYLPMRMIPVAFDAKGKYELLANKDISVASQVFQKFRRFSQGEVHSMFWDGVGMSLAWKTRRIKGTVADLGLEDLHNTGQKQLIVCLNTYSGAVGLSNEKTVIVTYELNTGQ